MKLISVAFLVLMSVSNLSGQDSLKYFIDKIAGAYLLYSKENALIIGTVQNGEEKIFVYGKSLKENGRVPSKDDVFEIGQITQSFTSVLFADMVIKGEINSDDELQKYLPDDVRVPVYEKIVCEPVQEEVPVQKGIEDYSRNKYTYYMCRPDSSEMIQKVLLCYLSTHTAGFPDRPSNLNGKKENPFAVYKKEELYDFLKEYTIEKPMGTNYQFSTIGIALLGLAIENKSKASFESLVNERICKKLGMTQTGFNEADSRLLLAGYNRKGKPAEHWSFEALAPSGALRSNMDDMLKFLKANIGVTQTPLKDVMDYTHNPRIFFNNEIAGESSVGLGWKINPLGIEGRNYVWQSGLTGGFASFIGFVETNRTGVVILSNTALPVEDMGKEILKKIN
jgi:CubicO group peptidase (beta-lactamase class C family)